MTKASVKLTREWDDEFSNLNSDASKQLIAKIKPEVCTLLLSSYAFFTFFLQVALFNAYFYKDTLRGDF